MIEWSQFISRANHGASQYSKSILQPLMPKKLKLNGSLRPTRPSGTNTKKWFPFHLRVLKCKSRKSRDTWSKRQFWPWRKEWSRAKANRVLPRERTGHSTFLKQHKRQLYTWILPDGNFNVNFNTEIKFILFFAVEDGEALYSQQKQDGELTVAQIMSSVLQN